MRKCCGNNPMETAAIETASIDAAAIDAAAMDAAVCHVYRTAVAMRI